MEAFLKITILRAANGIKVLVGCQEFVYMQKDLRLFISDLQFYLEDPEAARKSIFKRWGIKDDVSPDQPDAPIIRANRVEMADDSAKEVRETTQEESADPRRPARRG